MNIIAPKTSSWFADLTADHYKIGISRGAPRGYPAGYRIYSKLAPGKWFNKVDMQQYKKLYFEQLESLDAEEVLNDLCTMSMNKIPALLCFESPKNADQ